MLHAFKVFDVIVQTLLYGALILFVLMLVFIKGSILNYEEYLRGLSGSWLYVAGPIGIWHGMSCLVHAFLPKTWQLIKDRRVYGWIVIAYFSLALGLQVLERETSYRGQILIISLPIGLHYFWISWQELLTLHKPHAPI